MKPIFDNKAAEQHKRTIMKKWRIEYTNEYRGSPLSFWVHINIDSYYWADATIYEPSLPNPIAGKGYANLLINVLGVELNFSSIEEIEHFLSVIKLKNMPTTLQLTNKRNGGCGPNSHWLSRIPAKLLPWAKREKYIKTIESALFDFKLRYR